MTPYLSVVACSRNDEHGGNTLYRTQMFVDTFLEQCAKYELPGELVLVEWNPPADKPPLSEAIDWSRQGEFARCRVITVPEALHRTLRYSRQLPLFQMIAKNVGIRRARGEFILATNIDILISDPLFSRIARRDLRPDRLYRCDRFDIDSSIPRLPLEERMEFARTHLVRKNLRTSPPEIAAAQEGEAPASEILEIGRATGQFDIEDDPIAPALVAKPDIPALWLHMKQCGDFTMLHRDAWERIGGYAEFENYSLHIDSIGVHAAHRAGFRETWFAPPAVCYHIEHAMGSGYVPEAEKSLFDRLDAAGIGWFDYDFIHPFFVEMEERKAPLEFNDSRWGLRDWQLPETVCTATERQSVSAGELGGMPEGTSVGALRPEFDPLRHARFVQRYDRRDVARLSEVIKKLRDELNRAGEQNKSLRETLDQVRREYRAARERNTELSAQLGEARREVTDFAEKLRATRERLARYRRVFGGLERFGWFK